MAMFLRMTLAALTALGLWATAAPAQDLDAKVFRLGDLSAFASEQDDDTQLVHRRFYGGGYYGGFRPYYNYGYRPYYNYGYRPYYNYGYYPRFTFSYNYYRPYYYYAPPVYYYYPSYSYYYYPCNLTTTTSAFSGTVGSYYQYVPQKPVEPMTRPNDNGYATPMPMPPAPPREEDGTFPYDGGPARPVPMPSAEPQPQKLPQIDPAKGRVVSMPAPSTKFAYPAYGEKTAPASFAGDRPILIKTARN